MKTSTFIRLVELDGGDEAPKVGTPKITKVEPNAPLLQAKDKEPLIIQSEKPESETEQAVNLMTTYPTSPLEKGKTLSAPAGTVASKLSLKREPYKPKVLEPPKSPTGLRFAPAPAAEIMVPSVLEGKKKPSFKRTSLASYGIMGLAAIIGMVAAYYDEKERMQCFSKTGKEGFECRKKLKLKELEAKIGQLRKRLKECHTKIHADEYFLRQYCIETTEDKILDLRDEYRKLLASTYKEKKKK